MPTTFDNDELDNQPDATVSLHVVVDDRESSIGRLLDDVGEFVDEFHLVLDNPTHQVEQEIESRLVRHPWARQTIQHVSPSSHPNLYVEDDESAYLVGRPLDHEVMAGPFSKKFLLADLGAARNMSSLLSSCEWQLHLEPDDWVVSPPRLPLIVRLASKHQADVVSTQYTREYNTISPTPSWRQILARNLPTIHWRGRSQPRPVGQLSQINVEHVLPIGNRRLETAADLDRDFKLLYHEARSRGWDVPADHVESMILCLVRMGKTSPMPTDWVSGPLFSHYSRLAHDPDEVLRVRLLAGYLCDAGGDPESSSIHYARTLDLGPPPLVYFKLAQLDFQRAPQAASTDARQALWTSCIEHYELGCRASRHDPCYQKIAMATLVLVAMAHNLLGNKTRAQEAIDEVSKANMNSPAVALVWKKIYETP